LKSGKMTMPGKPILWTASKLYGLAVAIRNMLYDLGFFRSHSFAVPVICIGNITAGGTGKTPHVIYLAGKMALHADVAILSRGYLRKSRGFLRVTPGSLTPDTGDEPLLMAQSIPQAQVFVDRDRVNGIREILRLSPGVSVVILDDGFQHRAVKAGMNILLTDWNRLMTRDRILPLGMLRESTGAVKRADTVIVTKVPAETSPSEIEEVRKELAAAGAGTDIFFTSFGYGLPVGLFGNTPREIFTSTSVVLVTGIANPAPLAEYVGRIAGDVMHLPFPDHHKFNPDDINRITAAFDALAGDDKMIITTTKDGVRLKEIANIADHVRKALYCLPVSVQFIENEDVFLNKVYAYAGKDHQYS
jgi:tetraacyldisaccharide 4'-kinase